MCVYDFCCYCCLVVVYLTLLFAVVIAVDNCRCCVVCAWIKSNTFASFRSRCCSFRFIWFVCPKAFNVLAYTKWQQRARNMQICGFIIKFIKHAMAGCVTVMANTKWVWAIAVNIVQYFIWILKRVLLEYFTAIPVCCFRK